MCESADATEYQWPAVTDIQWLQARLPSRDGGPGYPLCNLAGTFPLSGFRRAPVGSTARYPVMMLAYARCGVHWCLCKLVCNVLALIMPCWWFSSKSTCLGYALCVTHFPRALWGWATKPLEFYINTFRVFSIGFNARVTAHLKHSSSSFLRLIIAFFAARKLEAKYKNCQVAHTLRCEDPDSNLNGISNYFLFFESLLRIPKQFLSFSKTIR